MRISIRALEESATVAAAAGDDPVFAEIAARGRLVQCHRRWTGVVGRLQCKRLASRRRYELLQLLEAEGLQRYQAAIAALYDTRACRRLTLGDLAEAGVLDGMVRPVHIQRLMVASKLASAGIAAPVAPGEGYWRGVTIPAHALALPAPHFGAGSAGVSTTRTMVAQTPMRASPAAAARTVSRTPPRAPYGAPSRLAVGSFAFVVRREGGVGATAERGARCTRIFLARVVQLGPRGQGWLKLELWNETGPGTREYTNGGATLVEHIGKLVPVALCDLVYDPKLRTVRCRNIPLIPGVSPAAVALPYLEESFACECDYDVLLTLRLVGEALPDLRSLLPVAHPGLAALGCVELGAQLTVRIVNTLSALLGAALRVRCAYASGVAVAVDVVGSFRAGHNATAAGEFSLFTVTLCANPANNLTCSSSYILH